MKVLTNNKLLGIVNPQDVMSGDYNEEYIRKKY